MAEGLLDRLVTVASGMPTPQGQSPAIDTAVDRAMEDEGFDPLVYLLEEMQKGEAEVNPATGMAQQAIQMQVDEMLSLQEESQAILGQLQTSSQEVRTANAGVEEVNLEIEQATTERNVQLEQELANLSVDRRAQLMDVTNQANSTMAEYITDLETMDAANDVGFMDFLKHPIKSFQTKLAGEKAQTSAQINQEKLRAIDAINKLNADSFVQQGDSIALEAKLRRAEQLGLYQQQNSRMSVLRAATTNRQLLQEDIQQLGQAFGLSGSILNGLASSLNAEIAVGNIKAGNFDRLLEAARLKQTQENLNRIRTEAERSDAARLATNSAIRRAYDGLGIPYEDPNTLVEQLATARELGVANDLQLSLVSQYVLGSGVNAASITSSADPIGTYSMLMQQNPDLVPAKLQEVMSTVRTNMRNGNGQTFEQAYPVPITDPKELRAAENAHFQSWWNATNANYNRVVDTFPGNLHSPSDITDYSAVPGFPAEVEELFKTIKVNTTSGESYFQELLFRLADDKADPEKLAMAAASISTMHFNGIQEGTGIMFQNMNIPIIGGDARNPQVWHNRIQVIRARNRARQASRDAAISTPLSNLY